MPLDVIVGAQWGDEGKGRITDLLAAEAHLVARVGGGDNAGHTVTVGDKQLKLHLLPSGVLYSHVICLLGGGMVLNPATLIEEIDHLAELGIDVSPNHIKISSSAHIITPGHLALDGAEETRRGGGELGTTRRGIGPAYTAKTARRGIRAGDMADPEHFSRQVENCVLADGELLTQVYELEAPDPDESQRTYREFAERLRPYLADIGAIVAEALEAGKNVLAEGAQGTLLDLDHGTYPFVTSSHPTTAGALMGLGVGPTYLRKVIGVTKAFQSRVGSGPFPTEASEATAERLRGTGENPWDEFGTTTGRPRRCGWLDGVLLRYANRINGFTELALTKLDVLTGIDPLHLCTAYRFEGRKVEDLPDSATDFSLFKPEYEEQTGWSQDLWEIRDWESLPEQARAYIDRVDSLCGVKVRLISVGPERSQIVVRN